MRTKIFSRSIAWAVVALTAAVSISHAITVSGQVLGCGGEALVGVRVICTGGSQQQEMLTDSQGNYSFSVTPGWAGEVYALPGQCNELGCPPFTDYTFKPAFTHEITQVFRGAPKPTIVAPSGGGTVYAGEVLHIDWNDFGVSPHETVVEVSRNGTNGPWEVIASQVGGASELDWTVTLPASNNCRLRVTNPCAAPGFETGPPQDMLSTDFVIKNRLSISAPQAGVTWDIGTSHTITWDNCESCGYTSLELLYSTTNPVLYGTIVANLPVSAKSYDWTVAGPVSSNARVMVKAWKGANDSEAVTSNSFKIDCIDVTMTAPVINGGHPRYIGATMTFSVAVNKTPCSPVQYQYSVSRDGGVNWEALALIANPSYVWTITGPSSTNCKARIVAYNDNETITMTTARFTIAACGDCPLPEQGRSAEAIPQRTGIVGNAPNPFTSSTAIQFELATSGPVAIEILDVSGRLVRRVNLGQQGVGPGEWVWDGRDDSNHRVGSGVYYARLTAAAVVDVRQVTMNK